LGGRRGEQGLSPPPPTHTHRAKINTDSAYWYDTGAASAAIIARGSKGEVVLMA
jgi:hypothetical protein